jgi:hypothetical protein
MSKSLSTITRGIAALALCVAGLTVFADASGAAAPGTPTGVSIAGASTGAVTVTWTNPSSTADAIDSYSVTVGGVVVKTLDTAGTANSTVGALGYTNTYTWTPSSALGTGAVHVVANGHSGLTTADGGSVTAAVLAAPTIGAVTNGNGTLSIAFTEDTADHAAQVSPAALLASGASVYNAVTNALIPSTCTLGTWSSSAYTASSCVVANSAVTASGTASSYSFYVKISNAAGISTASGNSTPNSTLATSPTAATSVVAVLNNTTRTVNLSWVAPTSVGDSGTLTYTIKNQSGTTVSTATISGTTATLPYNDAAVTGTSGAPYSGYFTVVATNSEGLTSTANSNSLIVGSNPLAPTSVAINGGNAISAGTTTVNVTFADPLTTGAKTLIGYSTQLYSCTTSTWSTSTCVASGSPISSPPGTTTSVAVSVTPGTYYTAIVTALNGSGPGISAAAPTPVLYSNAVPGTPAVTLTGKTNSSLSYSWTSVANGAAVSATSLQLYKSTTTGGSKTATATAAIAGVSTTITVTSLGASVGDVVWLYNASGVYIANCTVSAVTGTTAVVCATTLSAEVTTGTAATTVASVAVMVASGSPIAAGITTANTFSNLSGGYYALAVTTTNSVGSSSVGYSPALTPINVAPGTPTIAYTSTSAVTFTWTAAASTSVATTYLVDVTANKVLCSAVTTATSCTITAAQAAAAGAGALTGTHYFATYSVDANNYATGLSANSAALFNVNGGVALAAPTFVFSSAGVYLTWSAAAASVANIYYIAAYPSDGSTAINVTSTTTSYTFKAADLNSALTYVFRVKAGNAVGQNDWSNSSTVLDLTATATATVPTTPGTPTVTSIAMTNGNSVRYTWTASTGTPAVTSYIGTLVKADGSKLTCTTTQLSCVFAGVAPAQGNIANGVSLDQSSTWLSFTVIAVAPLQNSLASTAKVTTVAQDPATAGPVTTKSAVFDATPAGTSGATGTAGSPSVTVSWSPPTVNPLFFTAYQITFTNTTAGATQRPFYCAGTGRSGDSYLALFGSVNLVAANAGSTPSSTAPSIDCGAAGSFLHYVTNAYGESDGAALAAMIPGNTYSVSVAAISFTPPSNLLNGNASSACTVVSGYYTGVYASAPYAAACGAMAAIGAASLAGALANYTWDTALTAASGTGLLGSVATSMTGSVNGSSLNNVAASTSTIPTKPSAPTSVAAALNGNVAVTVTWSAPSSNGGSAITGYTVSMIDTTTASASANVSSCVGITVLTCAVTGLTSGDAYTFSVVAINAFGTSDASSASTGVTAVATLAAPAGVWAHGTYTSTTTGVPVLISWLPVTGATSYTVAFTDINSSGGTQTTTTTVSSTTTYLTEPASLTGAFDTFSVTVTANNAAGAGTSSAAKTNSSTQSAAPSVPNTVADYQSGTGTTPTADVLTWTAPTTTYGLPVTYTIYQVVGGVATQVGTVLAGAALTWTGTYNANITNLYVCSVNLIGGGVPPSSLGSCVDVSTKYFKNGVPTMPTVSVGTPTSSSTTQLSAETLSVTAGDTNNGGTGTPPITSVTGTATGADGSTGTCTVSSPSIGVAGNCAFTGLNPNVVYTFSVVETDFNGSSIAATGTFKTPITTPGAAASSSVTFTDVTATVTWTAPTLNGGAPVSYYLVHVGSKYLMTSAATLTASFSGLTAGTSTACTITAWNVAGQGTEKSCTFTTLPAAIDPPAAIIITTGLYKPTYPAFGSMNLTFKMNMVTTGSQAALYPVTGYRCIATAADGTTVNGTTAFNVTTDMGTCSLTGLSNVAYTVHVYALSGFSAADSSTGVVDNNGTAVVSNTWVNDAPALFGGASAVSGTVSIQGLAPLKDFTTSNATNTVSPLAVGSVTDNLVPTSYVLKASLTSGGAVAATTTCTSLATPCTITGLVSGSKYYVSVLPVNDAGNATVWWEQVFTVLSATAPAAPTAIAATRNATGLAITWTAPVTVGSGQLVGYWVTATDPLTTQQYSCPYNATYGLILAPATSCSINGLSAGSSYNISITAITQDGAGVKQLSAPATKTGVLYNVLAPEPVMATFLAVTAKQKSVSALSPAAKTALSGLISSTNDGAQITIAGYGTTKAIALARANAAANYLFRNGAAVHVTIKSVISKTVKTALVTVTVN